MLDLCQRQGHTVLYQKVTALQIPRPEDSPATWARFTYELIQVIGSEQLFVRYQKLQTEAAEAASEQSQHRIRTREEFQTLVLYCNAVRLLYDCLQLAYTPDRRAFEDRIFLPPP